MIIIIQNIGFNMIFRIKYNRKIYTKKPKKGLIHLSDPLNQLQSYSKHQNAWAYYDTVKLLILFLIGKRGQVVLQKVGN